MKNYRRFFFAFLAFTALASLRATTVIPPRFNQLVDQAEVIFQGSVADVRSAWVGEGAQRHIVSYVTFNVEDTLKGNAGATYTMQLLGGTVGDETMEVTDSPKFEVGDRNILFVEHNGSQFIPLVGIMHGQFRLQHDQASGLDIVANGEGHPVTNVARIGTDEGEAAPAEGHALSLDQFKAEIHSRTEDVKSGRASSAAVQ